LLSLSVLWDKVYWRSLPCQTIKSLTVAQKVYLLVAIRETSMRLFPFGGRKRSMRGFAKMVGLEVPCDLLAIRYWPKRPRFA